MEMFASFYDYVCKLWSIVYTSQEPKDSIYWDAKLSLHFIFLIDYKSLLQIQTDHMTYSLFLA